MLIPDILDTFRSLLEQARAAGDPEPTAMTLATRDGAGRIAARIVLLKDVDERGFCFFSNYDSAKGAELGAYPQVALCFHWKTAGDAAAGGVQVRIEGEASRLSAAESDAYFATRQRGSQIGAWASLQSQTLPDHEAFDARVARYEREFTGRDVPRPQHWGAIGSKPMRSNSGTARNTACTSACAGNGATALGRSDCCIRERRVVKICILSLRI